jgi:hypothetical protein
LAIFTEPADKRTGPEIGRRKKPVQIQSYCYTLYPEPQISDLLVKTIAVGLSKSHLLLKT